MSRPRVVSLEEKFEWMRQRQAEKAAAAPPPADPPVPQVKVKIKRTKPEVPARFIMHSVAEVAEMFGVSNETIRQWFEGYCAVVGERVSSPSRRRRRVFLISQQDIEDFLARHHR